MRWGVAFVAALCLAALVPGIDAIGPVDSREARDLEVARELITAREPLTPILGFEPLFERPLLAYAPDVLATLARGADPVGASRRWRVAAAVLLVLVTGAIGARHLGARAGVCAAAVLSSALALPLAARLDGPQLLAALLAWIAIDGFSGAWFGRRAGREMRLVTAWMAIAGATLSAGPLAGLWPLGAVALYLALVRRPDRWRELRPVAGLLIVAGLTLPWYVAMIERHGAEFLRHAAFFPFGLGRRSGWLIGPFLAVSFVVVGFFPWSALLPGAIRHAGVWWRKPRPGAADGARVAAAARELGEEHAAHWFLSCAVASLTPLVFYPSPPVWAALPALPALALVCGRLLDHLIEDQSRVGEPVLRATQILSMTGTVAALFLLLAAGRVPEGAASLRLLATVVFVTSWLPFLASLLSRFRLAALLMTLPVGVGAPVASLEVLPTVEGYLGTRAVAQAMNRVAPERAPLVVLEEPPPSLRLLARHNLVRIEWLGGALDRVRAADGYVYVAYRPGRESEVPGLLAPTGAPIETLVRTPSLVLARVRG